LLAIGAGCLLHYKLMGQLKLLAGRSHPQLWTEIADFLDTKLCKVELSDFANGEISFKLGESVRGDDVFIMQTHSQNPNDAIIEQAIMIDAAKRSSASSITALCPFLGYARQDRKSTGREPITARLVVDILANAGADRIMSVDLHSGQTQGFFDGPFDHLIARPSLVNHFKAMFKGDDVVIVAPDAGRVKSAERYSDAMDCNIAIIHKQRSTTENNKVEARYLMGDVKNKVCIIIDDMIDTAGTICAAAQMIADNGAKSVYGVATHGVLSKPALERIDESVFEKVIVTNTLPQHPELSKKLEVVSIAPLLAEAVKAVHTLGSVSALFDGKNQF
jgi:ribose-phosphate pyrophosphokinase